MKNRMKLVVAGLALLSLGTLAACKGHHGHDPAKMKQHVDSSLKKIGASDEQRAKIGVITDKIFGEGAEICKSNQGLGKKVVACLLQDKPNKEWLHQVVDEKARELTAFAHRTVDNLIEINGNLTPEQRLELKSRIESAHGKKH